MNLGIPALMIFSVVLVVWTDCVDYFIVFYPLFRSVIDGVFSLCFG